MNDFIFDLQRFTAVELQMTDTSKFKLGETTCDDLAALQTAINALEADDTITVKTVITITNSDTATLDFGGRTVNVSDNTTKNFYPFTIKGSGSLTLSNMTANITATASDLCFIHTEDSIELTVDNVNVTCGTGTQTASALHVAGSSKVTATNSTLTSNSGNTIFLRDTATVILGEGTTVERTAGTNAVISTATATSADNDDKIHTGTTLKIQGAEIIAPNTNTTRAIEFVGTTFEMTSGSITNNGSGSALNLGLYNKTSSAATGRTATISGGTIETKGSSANAVKIGDNMAVTVSGSTVVTGTSSSFEFTGSANTSKLTVSGGTFTGAITKTNTSSVVSISGGTYTFPASTTEAALPLAASASVVVNGSTITTPESQANASITVSTSSDTTPLLSAVSGLAAGDKVTQGSTAGALALKVGTTESANSFTAVSASTTFTATSDGVSADLKGSKSVTLTNKFTGDASADGTVTFKSGAYDSMSGTITVSGMNTTAFSLGDGKNSFQGSAEKDSVTFKDGSYDSMSGTITVTPDATDGFALDGVTYTGDSSNGGSVVFKDGVQNSLDTTAGKIITAAIATTSTNGVKDSAGNIFKASGSAATVKFTAGATTKDSWTSGTVAVTVASGKSITLANETMIAASGGTAAVTVAEGVLSALGTGTVTVTPKSPSAGITIDGVTYTGDGTGALTFKDEALTSVGSSNTVYATLTKSSTNGITVGNVTYKATDADTQLTFTAGALSSIGSGEVSATIAAGKSLTYDGITYKENSNSTAEVIFTNDGSTVKPTFGTGSVVVSASSETKDITVGEVGLTVSNSDTVILTTADSVTSAAVKAGTVKATFNSVDDKIQIGNVTYTATENASSENSTTINFTNKDTDGATLTGGSIQLSKDSAYNRYVSTNATINAAVGSATVANVGSSAIIGISGSADETVSIAKAISSVSSGTAFTLNEKSLNIYGDSNGYTAVAKSDGTLGEISGISKGATISAAADATLNTDNQGAFYFDSDMYSISGDDSVTFLTNESSKVANITNFVGTLKSSASSNTINGAAYSITTVSNSSIGAVAISTDGTGITAVNGLVSGETISGDLDNAAISMKGSSGTETNVLTINGTTFKVSGDKDGVVITGKEITGLASGATLTANAAGTYTINGESIQISGDEDIIVGNADGSANKKEAGDVEVTSTTSVEEIAEQAVGDTSNRSTLSAAATAELLESDNKDGDYTVNITSSTSTSDSTVDFSESTGKKTVNLTSAADVAFNDEGGNIANIGESVSKATNVSLGNGGDLAVVENSAEVNITAGAGQDTIVTKNAKSSVTVDLSAGGATKVMPSAGTIVLENYDDSKGAGIQTTSNNIAKAVEGGNINGANGSITVGSGVVEISSNDEEESTSTMVNIYNLKGKMQKVGFTNNDGGSVGSSETKQAMVLKGNYSSDKSGGSTMQGGKGNDTIFAGATDEVNAGGGSNVIGLTSNRSGSSDGATINMNAEDNGRTTITGGFDQTSDKLNVGEDATYTYDGEKLVVKNGKSRLTVENATSDSSSNDIARSYDIGSENSYTFIQGSGDETVRVAVGAENGVIAVKSNEDEIATSYHGTKSGIDLTNFEGDAVINLATASATLGGVDDVSIDGVTKLMAGNGDAILAGSEANETIAAGSGNVTIWGGKGKDLLVGNTDTENKNGAATFYYQSGDGRDTIQNFTFLSEDTDGLADSIMSTADISEVKATNGNVVIQYSATDNLIVEGGVGKNISFSDGKVMQVNDELTFDGYANYFVGTSNKATLSVEGENVSNANIWLDNTQSGYYSSNIKVLDASNYEGQSTLVGNANNNTITASKDGALMWGGSSSGNNTLICGAGDDTIYYAGNANDEITGAGESDLILLGGNLNGVSINIEGTDIAFKYNTGNSVTIENAVTSGVGIQVNGVTYMYNGEGWEQK